METIDQYYKERRELMEDVSSILDDINFYDDIKDMNLGWFMTRVKNLYYKLLLRRIKLTNKIIKEFNDDYQGYPFPVDFIEFQ